MGAVHPSDGGRIQKVLLKLSLCARKRVLAITGLIVAGLIVFGWIGRFRIVLLYHEFMIARTVDLTKGYPPVANYRGSGQVLSLCKKHENVRKIVTRRLKAGTYPPRVEAHILWRVNMCLDPEDVCEILIRYLRSDDEWRIDLAAAELLLPSRPDNPYTLQQLTALAAALRSARERAVKVSPLNQGIVKLMDASIRTVDACIREAQQ